MEYLINERSREIRKRIRLSQTDYANLLGVKRSTIGSYDENRAMVPLELIPKIMELGLIRKEDMYSFIFDADYKF